MIFGQFSLGNFAEFIICPKSSLFGFCILDSCLMAQKLVIFFLSLSTSGDHETYLSSKMKTERKKKCQIIIGYTVAQHCTQV